MPLDSKTRATCTLQKMEPGCMVEPSWGSIPGKTQVPGESTRPAGHQKISAALEPSYGWHHACLTGNSSVFTKQEWGGGRGGIAGLLSIDQQAELCSTALLMPAQSTGIAFWCLPTGKFPVTNHILQMTNLINERSHQISLDHLSESQYLGPKVQTYSESNWINALCHVVPCQPASRTPGNFCKQTSSNYIWLGFIFTAACVFKID